MGKLRHEERSAAVCHDCGVKMAVLDGCPVLAAVIQREKALMGDFGWHVNTYELRMPHLFP